MKKQLFLASLLMFACGVHAQNLIQNGSFDKPLTKETRIMKNTGWAVLKIFTEDTTWNKAARMTVTQIHEVKNSDRKIFLTYFFIGGDGKKMDSTFKLKPNKTYRYSLKIKTNIKPEQATILCRIGKFDALAREKKQLTKTNPLKNLNEKNWTTVSGTFHSGNLTEALILIAIYSDTQYGKKMLMKVGNWLMVDDIVVEEVPELPSTAQLKKKRLIL